jgi:tetratricopeptide (TPR) repeat protein
MLGIIFILVLGAGIFLWRPSDSKELVAPNKFAAQLDKLWDISRISIKNRRYLQAEKALLTILRVNERDARAYNHLGVLYAKQRQFDDAIECFEIAQSLQPSASSLHNVGLIYYEAEKFDKAEQAFEQAIKMESDVASRHIAYAKVLEITGQTAKMIEALEEAVRLEPNPESIIILADALDRSDNPERADKLRTIAKNMAIKGQRARIKQQRRIQV